MQFKNVLQRKFVCDTHYFNIIHILIFYLTNLTLYVTYLEYLQI